VAAEPSGNRSWEGREVLRRASVSKWYPTRRMWIQTLFPSSTSVVNPVPSRSCARPRRCARARSTGSRRPSPDADREHPPVPVSRIVTNSYRTRGDVRLRQARGHAVSPTCALAQGRELDHRDGLKHASQKVTEFREKGCHYTSSSYPASIATWGRLSHVFQAGDTGSLLCSRHRS